MDASRRNTGNLDSEFSRDSIGLSTSSLFEPARDAGLEPSFAFEVEGGLTRDTGPGMLLMVEFLDLFVPHDKKLDLDPGREGGESNGPVNPPDNALRKNRSSRPEVFCKEGFLGNFAKFTGKHLCQSIFF